MIRIVEVGPRDGLQNEAAHIATATKVRFVDLLAQSGVDEVEVSAFVSPQWVPQLGDADEVFAKIARVEGVVYSALVPNERGMDRAEAACIDKVSIFTAASDTFNRKNVNTDIAGTYLRLGPVIARARAAKLRTRGYVSTAFWCPYEGQIAPLQVLGVAQRLLDLGVDEVSIGDTIGKATPSEVRALLEVLLAKIPAAQLALHCHDTYGRAIANVRAAVAMGIDMFDASVGGLGGCPYAPGAPGNVATEALVGALRDAGHRLRVAEKTLQQARALIAPYVTRLAPLPAPDDAL